MENNTIGLKELAKVFFKLGCLGFGGPAAHIAMMQREIVEKRKWLNLQEFLELISITHLIPGPNSTELAIHIGYTTRGWKGLFIAGICFIFPAVVLTCILAYFYKQYGQLPEVETYLYGLKPSITIIILLLVFKLTTQFITNPKSIILTCGVFVLSLAGYSEMTLLLLTLALSLLYYTYYRVSRNHLPSFIPLLAIPYTGYHADVNIKLFWIFLKIGSVLYGSGYVLFSFIETELVHKGLLTRTQLIDAITAGQITPGPVFSSVTFVGYQIGGWSGAVFSTIAVFIPSFLLILLITPIVHYLKRSNLFQLILKAVNITSIALIASVCISLTSESIRDKNDFIIALTILSISLFFKKINTGILLLIGLILGKLLLFLAPYF